MGSGIEAAPTSSLKWSRSTTKIKPSKFNTSTVPSLKWEFDSWNEQLLDELIDGADAPEDWSGAVDVEAEDLDREFEDTARSLWSSPNDRSLRR